MVGRVGECVSGAVRKIPVQLVARCADEAIEKLKLLVDFGVPLRGSRGLDR